MIGRAGVLILALVIGLTLPLGGAAVAGDAGDDAAALPRRDDEPGTLFAADDDGGDDDTRSRSRKSFDRTNSRFTGVSRDGDWSRRDLTRDWTRDGPGGKKRDWSRHQTNDRSRNDTR
jgi:hypothetical protein